MLVQSCTEGKPASVRQHPAGQWWNYVSVPPSVYTSFALVSNRSCPVSILPRICLSFTPSVVVHPRFSGPCSRPHTRDNVAWRVRHGGGQE